MKLIFTLLLIFILASCLPQQEICSTRGCYDAPTRSYTLYHPKNMPKGVYVAYCHSCSYHIDNATGGALKAMKQGYYWE